KSPRLVLPAGLIAHHANTAQRTNEVAAIDVGPDAPGRRRSVDQRLDRPPDPLMDVREQLAVAVVSRKLQGCGEAALGRHVADEVEHPKLERDVWRVLGEELVRGIAQLLDAVAVGRFDERIAGGEVPIERPDADAGPAGDVFK